MARVHTTHEADCNSLARRCSSALLLLAIAGLLVACGGSGGAQAPAPGGGGSGGSTSLNTATLAWDAVTDPSLSGYRIYYGAAQGTYIQSLGQGVNVGNVLTYTVTGLSSGTRYYFAATAYDTIGNESGYSNEVFKDIP